MNKQQTRHFTCDSKQRFQENFQFISLWRSAVFVYMDHRKHNTSSALCLSILSSTFFFLLEVDSFFFGIDLWFMGVILIKSLLRATNWLLGQASSRYLQRTGWNFSSSNPTTDNVLPCSTLCSPCPQHCQKSCSLEFQEHEAAFQIPWPCFHQQLQLNSD